MQKNYARNKKILSRISNVRLKRVVDINILLNRVKIEEKNEIKKKIIFYSLTTIALSLFVTFIMVIK